MTVALQVAVECIDYVWESNTWQEKLKNESNQVIEKWENDVVAEVTIKMIPDYKTENRKNVRAVYAQFEEEIINLIMDAQNKHAKDDVYYLNEDMTLLRGIIKQLE